MIGLFLIQAVLHASTQPDSADLTNSAITLEDVESAAQRCGTKIEISSLDMPDGRTHFRNPTISISLFSDNSNEAVRCFQNRIPNVFSYPVMRKSDAKYITNGDIVALKSKCDWTDVDGKIAIDEDGSLFLNPSENAEYVKVDCALGEIRKFRLSKFGFEGNEVYQTDENGDTAPESDKKR
ncbi:MAG: hypothetical protein AAGE37_08285 [Pseudomonadota bacterium]